MGIDITKLNTPTESLADKLAKAKAAKAAQALAAPQKAVEPVKEFEYAPADSAPEQLAIVFDDSGSMDNGTRLRDAKDGCIEFMRHCAVNFTAISIITMEGPTLALTTNLPALSVQVKALHTTGGTPLYGTLLKALRSNPKLKRIVAFSDGSPTDGEDKAMALAALIESGKPVDTVYISDERTHNHGGTLIDKKQSHGYKTLLEISERTGGVCILYDKSKTQFSTIMKHLTSGNRLALTAGGASAITALEEGVTK